MLACVHVCVVKIAGGASEVPLGVILRFSWVEKGVENTYGDCYRVFMSPAGILAESITMRTGHVTKHMQCC